MSATESSFFFFFQAEDGIRDYKVTGVQTCALPISGVETVGDGVGHLVGLVDGIDARACLVAWIDARGGPAAGLVLWIGLLVDAADLDEVGSRLDDVLERCNAPRAGEVVDPRDACLDQRAELLLLTEAEGLSGVLD